MTRRACNSALTGSAQEARHVVPRFEMNLICPLPHFIEFSTEPSLTGFD